MLWSSLKKKKKNSRTSDLSLYNKLAQNLVAKPTVFIIFCGFRGSGIQEHLGWGVPVEGLAWGHRHMSAGAASHLKARLRLEDLLQGGSFT